MKLSINLLAGLLLGIAGGLSVLLFQQMVFPRQTIAIVDLQEIIVEQMEGAAKSGESLSEEEIQLQAEAFAQQLDHEVDSLARDFNALLLVSPAVIKGAPDLTIELRDRIQRAQAAGK